MLLVQESSIPDCWQAAHPAYAEAGFVCIKKNPPQISLRRAEISTRGTTQIAPFGASLRLHQVLGTNAAFTGEPNGRAAQRSDSEVIVLGFPSARSQQMQVLCTPDESRPSSS